MIKLFIGYMLSGRAWSLSEVEMQSRPHLKPLGLLRKVHTYKMYFILCNARRDIFKL